MKGRAACWLLKGEDGPGEDGRVQCLQGPDIMDAVSKRYLMHASGQ